jgi:hypothetical protein
MAVRSSSTRLNWLQALIGHTHQQSAPIGCYAKLAVAGLLPALGVALFEKPRVAHQNPVAVFRRELDGDFARFARLA